ncbi:heavy metal translocating P-type ATPase [Spirochaeta dissipatitropha]
MHEHEHGEHHHEQHTKENHAGHDHKEHAGHDPAMFRAKFWISLLLTFPVLYWSGHIQQLLGFTALEIPGAQFIPSVLGTLIFLYGGLVFLKGAWQEIRALLPGMMTLISLAISVAFTFSLIVEFGLLDAQALWWELASLITIMLLGHWIEMRSISQAQGALQELAKLLPDTAVLVSGGEEREVPVHDLQKGDIVLVRPGDSIPVDGRVQSGESKINEAMVTGESRPATRSKGDEVIAGTINGSGSLRIEVSGTGEETRLSGIMRLVSDAQQSKSRVQHLADRAARWLTAVALVSGVTTLIVWLLIGASIDFAIIRVVTVLVIACPHALGLAVPLVVANSTSLGAKAGLLVRDRRGLEEARHIDTVVFDKTGTLTLGEFRVVEMQTADGIAEDVALSISAAVESESEHPIARGIVATARDRSLEIPGIEGFNSIPGKGVSAKVDGVEYAVGGPALLDDHSVEVPEVLRKAAESAAERGQAAIYLIQDSSVLAVFAVADAIREESKEVMRELHDLNIQIVMLTGDARAVAESVARELNIDTVFSEVLPEDKSEKIKELQKSGKKVAMVGDGVNDAPALAIAELGIAIGAGTDVAVEAGHIVLVRSDPRDIPRIFHLSRVTYRKMVQNLWWAAGYNIAAIPLAAGALAAFGIMLSPAVGAVLMSASTVIVAVNAQLIRRSNI